jgi:hypothetical protein
MTIQLTPSWYLTNEHAASSYGIPVLVQRKDGSTIGAFGPDDIVQCYPSWPMQPARQAVARMALTAGYAGRLGDGGMDFVVKFTGEVPA